MIAHPSKLAAEAPQGPSAAAAVLTLASVTLTRLTRGKAMWIGIAIAALPAVFAGGLRIAATGTSSFRPLLAIAMLVLAVLPAMFIGASIGEEIEERTSTYLWSRPIARWAVVAGKLVALAPIVIVLIAAGWVAAVYLWLGAPPSPASCLALAAGGLAGSLVAAGVATILPRHGMGLTISYLLLDGFVGALPVSLREISITHQTRVLTHLVKREAATGGPLVMLAVVCAIWIAIGLLRIRRLET